MMVLGFTGTRRDPTPAQIDWFTAYLGMTRPRRLHHGACVGADAMAHQCAIDRDMSVIIHPPTKTHLMMDLTPWRDHPLVTILEPKPYHDRNRDIVIACDRLVAMPEYSAWGAHSGTWYTADYALSQLVAVTMCPPNGKAYRYER